MKYAHLDNKTGEILGWYPDDIYGTWIAPEYNKDILVKDGFYDISKIPTPNIGVSDEVWQEAININANFYENKKFIVKDEVTVDENVVPTKITRLQAKLQLLEIGLLDEVEEMVKQDRRVELYWTDTQSIERNHPILNQMATSLGLTSEQLDDLFIEASKLS